MMTKPEPVWILPEKQDIPEALQQLGLPKLALALLCRRGYQNKSVVEDFLNPSLARLHNPKLLPDMEKAVERILTAIKKKEKILIYGDYDVDGTCGTALLVRILKKIGANVSFYIPHRELEGYGLSETGVLSAKENGFTLIVTTDCGTTDFPEIEMANNSGIDVIVCDHHEPRTFSQEGVSNISDFSSLHQTTGEKGRGEPKDSLPKALAIINPKRHDTDYPFNELAGVGVSFKLAWALLSATGNTKEDLLEQLDLVALGTIADVAPLLDENRALAKFGMLKIKDTKKVGLRALLKIAGLSGKPITPYEIGFILGPRINASGRISEAGKAVELLITEDEKRAEAIAKELDLENQKRQKIEEEILLKASEQVERMDLAKKRFLVLADETWHEGVVGIVASRIVEKFYRPTILIALKEDRGKGSGRSIPGFHLYQALKNCEEHLIGFGGHKYAAGLTICRENINKFSDLIDEYARNNAAEELFQKKVFIDAQASLYDFDQEFLKTLAKFEPFGPENPEPVFMTTGLEVVGYPKIVGKDKDHLRFKVRENKDRVLDVIAFGKSEAILKLVKGQEDHLDIVYYLDENSFAGKTRLQLKIKDMKIRG